MRINLIRPNIGFAVKKSGEKIDFVDEARMEPLQLAAIAGVTPSEFEVKMYDDRLEDIPYNDNVDLVAITVEIYTARRAYQIAEKFRKRNIKVLLGGIHVSLMPEEAMKYADSILVGDAENIWHQVLQDLKNGSLKTRYDATISCPSPGVFPDRTIYNGKKYLPFALLQFGRGCHYSCNFCAISSYFKRQHFTRNINEILTEIESMNRKLLFFVDDNIVANIDAAKQLFRALIPYKIKWVGQASIDMTRDRELMSLMEKSGCLGHVIGFESVSEQGLKLLNKSPNIKRFNQYTEQIKILEDYGIQAWAAFTIGHDNENKSSIERTLDFANKHKFTFAAFNILMPYPNTPLYTKLEQENRLLYNGKWWLDENYKFNHAAFIPKNFTPDELTQEAYYLKREFNSYPSISRRLLKAITNRKTVLRIAMLLRYSLLFRKESFKKQKMRFGIKN